MTVDENLISEVIQIKVLTVDKKRVTLSVFKQFKEEALIDYVSLKLAGKPWGIVNHFWGNDAKNFKRGTIHLLWQKDDELRRCIIKPIPSQEEILDNVFRKRDSAPSFMSLEARRNFDLLERKFEKFVDQELEFSADREIQAWLTYKGQPEKDRIISYCQSELEQLTSSLELTKGVYSYLANLDQIFISI